MPAVQAYVDIWISVHHHTDSLVNSWIRLDNIGQCNKRIARNAMNMHVHVYVYIYIYVYVYWMTLDKSSSYNMSRSIIWHSGIKSFGGSDLQGSLVASSNLS